MISQIEEITNSLAGNQCIYVQVALVIRAFMTSQIEKKMFVIGNVLIVLKYVIQDETESF